YDDENGTELDEQHVTIAPSDEVEVENPQNLDGLGDIVAGIAVDRIKVARAVLRDRPATKILESQHIAAASVGALEINDDITVGFALPEDEGVHTPAARERIATGTAVDAVVAAISGNQVAHRVAGCGQPACANEIELFQICTEREG